ncbi:MAG: hypothetical protein K6E70_12015 [Butyrivibrio sp.]|nr:hypothetical protein [Butyrivibrio sp.]
MGSFIDNNFFVIDSNSLEKVESHLYGFSMVNENIVNDSNYQGEKLCWGAYVNVIRTDSQIIIKQDNVGSQGIYLFKSEDYFAISNSFMMLMDYLKCKHTLTINEKYADAFLASGLCVYSFDETLINEISVIDRNAEIYIDITKRVLSMEVVNTEENTISIGTKEGIKQLDLWYEKWSSVIYGLISRDEQVIVDLTGGFDSRMVFTLFLHPEINLSRVMIKSDNDKRYTHEEDYAIASKIKEKFGFELNRLVETGGEVLYNALDDALDIIFYDKFGFHNGMEIREKSHEKGEYHFSGNGGETVRSGDMAKESVYISQKAKARSSDFPRKVRLRFSEAISEVMRRSYYLTGEKLQKNWGGVQNLLT